MDGAERPSPSPSRSGVQQHQPKSSHALLYYVFDSDGLIIITLPIDTTVGVSKRGARFTRLLRRSNSAGEALHIVAQVSCALLDETAEDAVKCQSSVHDAGRRTEARTCTPERRPKEASDSKLPYPIHTTTSYQYLPYRTALLHLHHRPFGPDTSLCDPDPDPDPDHDTTSPWTGALVAVVVAVAVR